jgi:hypothetical protein
LVSRIERNGHGLLTFAMNSSDKLFPVASPHPFSGGSCNSKVSVRKTALDSLGQFIKIHIATVYLPRIHLTLSEPKFVEGERERRESVQ